MLASLRGTFSDLYISLKEVRPVSGAVPIPIGREVSGQGGAEPFETTYPRGCAEK